MLTPSRLALLVASLGFISAPAVLAHDAATGKDDAPTATATASASDDADAGGKGGVWDSILDLDLRLSSLEDTKVRMRFGGWFDFLYRVSDQSGSKEYFDLHHIYLIGDARLNDWFRAFFEVEYEHLPKFEGGTSGSGEMMIERGYIEGAYSEALILRLGKFNTPLGIRTPAHWQVLTPVLQKPIFEDNGYVPAKSVGVQLLGSYQVPMSTPLDLRYSAYVSNGGEASGTNKPSDTIGGFGGDLQVRLAERYMVGFSLYRQQNAAFSRRREITSLIYGELDLPVVNVLLRGEWELQHRDEGYRNVRSWYLLGRYTVHGLETVSVTYRLDMGDDERRNQGGMHTVHNVNLRWQPFTFLQLAAEVNLHDFRGSATEDYNAASLWVGVTF